MKTIGFYFSKYFWPTYTKSFKEISPEIIKGVDYVVNLQRDKLLKTIYNY
jgi:hypothetical protein